MLFLVKSYICKSVWKWYPLPLNIFLYPLNFAAVETEKQFSIKQSNILYLFFCLSSSLCIFGDLWHQWMRGKNVNIKKCLQLWSGSPLSQFTSAGCIIFGADILLWIDFMVSNRNLDAVPSNGEGFIHDLMRYTTHAAFCVLLLPFFGLYKLVSRFVCLLYAEPNS